MRKKSYEKICVFLIGQESLLKMDKNSFLFDYKEIRCYGKITESNIYNLEIMPVTYDDIGNGNGKSLIVNF